jgi:hypothetical protein
MGRESGLPNTSRIQESIAILDTDCARRATAASGQRRR